MASDATTTTAAPNGGGGGEKKKILICDDQPDILYVTSAFLREHYEVLTAKSGRECLSSLGEEAKKGRRVDALLLDYKLGDVRGDDVAREVRRLTNGGGSKTTTKIILITAYELDDSTLSGLLQENVIDSQLKKPFSLAELEREVRSQVSEPAATAAAGINAGVDTRKISHDDDERADRSLIMRNTTGALQAFEHQR